MKSLSKSILRGLYGAMLAATFATLVVASVGCREATKKPTDPAEIEKARQQQIDISRREAANQG